MAILQETEIKKGKGRLTFIIIMAILSLGIPVEIFPFLWSLSNSFKKPLEVIHVPVTIIPHEWTMEGIIEIFRKYNLMQNIWSTVVLCGGTILIQVSISLLAAYSLSKLSPKRGNLVLLLFIGTMMISSQALIFPTYLMMTNFPIIHKSLINNYISYILISSAWGYSIFLFKGFFDGIPNELMDSADIDGAGPVGKLTNIILPLSKPVIAVNVLNTFIAVYNDIIMPMLLLPSDEKWTVMVRLYVLQSGTSNSVPLNTIFALITIATIPVIIVYLFAQKNVVEGISMTGLKG